VDILARACPTRQSSTKSLGRGFSKLNHQALRQEDFYRPAQMDAHADCNRDLQESRDFNDRAMEPSKVDTPLLEVRD